MVRILLILGFLFAGKGAHAQLVLGDREIDFGEIAVGDSDSSRTILRWTGSTAGWINFHYNLPWDMSLRHNCPILMSPGCICDIEVEFSPTEVDDYDGVVEISTRDGHSAVKLEVIGQGVVESK